MADANKTSACSLASRLVFSCSGAADIVETSDKAARRLAKDGTERKGIVR